MALVPINEPVLAPSVNGYLVAVSGASVEVRAASSATLGAGALVPAWTTPAGTTRAEPLSSVNGRVNAFVEEQFVDLVIGAVAGVSLATIRRVPVGWPARENSRTVLTRNADGTIATATDNLGRVTDQIVRGAAGITGFREDGVIRSVVRAANGKIMEVT